MPCAVCGGFAAGLGARHERAAPVRQQQHRGVPRIGVERLAHHHARLGPLRTHRAHNPGRDGSLPGIFRVGKMKRIARAVDVRPLALECKAFAVVLGESSDLHVADIATQPRPGQRSVRAQLSGRRAGAHLVAGLDRVKIQATSLERRVVILRLGQAIGDFLRCTARLFRAKNSVTTRIDRVDRIDTLHPRQTNALLRRASHETGRNTRGTGRFCRDDPRPVMGQRP